MKANKWNIILFCLIVIDIVYTFLQCYFTTHLDGDLVNIIAPSDGYKTVLSDPFGFAAVFKNESYPAAGRFFIHWITMFYFRTVPFVFQLIADPIDSIYLSFAFARTIIQVLIIYFLANMISNNNRIWNRTFLSAALIITPMFQVCGYADQMGITVNMITYTFFYALPFVFILMFFKPFFSFLFYNNSIKLNMLDHIVLISAALIISFGGPLGPPIVIIACPAALIYFILKNWFKFKGDLFSNKLLRVIKNIPTQLLFYFILITILCLYSSLVGTHNSENAWFNVPILERYKLLPQGFWALNSIKLGPPLLLGLCVLNSILIFRIKNESAGKHFRVSCAIGIFCFIYLLLLPLGGYRAYRPLIIRSDTYAPVTLSLIFVYGYTSLYLLYAYKNKAQMLFISFIVIVTIIFTNADKMNRNGNLCEIGELHKIASSLDSVVELDEPCTVLSWSRFSDSNISRLNSDFLYYWHITKDKKLFYFSQ